MLNVEGLGEARGLLLSRPAAENFEWKKRRRIFGQVNGTHLRWSLIRNEGVCELLQRPDIMKYSNLEGVIPLCGKIICLL